MRATIVIPSYWGRASTEPFDNSDAVYDHPTPLDSEGTLERALRSIEVLENRDFNVVVLAAATNPEISVLVEDRVKGIVDGFKDEFPVTCLSHSFERKLKDRVAELASDEGLTDLVSLTGYSNIRNMCLIAAELAGSELCVLFDDDEVYEDPEYLDKVFEDFDTVWNGKPVRAVAGYYLQPDGGYLLDPPDSWWMAEWPMVRTMNEAFEIIGSGPRLQLTPFVFGGNMVVHRDVFRRLPFDPNVRRGEDIDYLVDCKFFDVDFLLDRELSIRHLPPGSVVPPWRHFRENIYRFVYTREKLRRQDGATALRELSVEELDPYPGSCMRDDLEELVFRTSVLMGLHSMDEKDAVGFQESMRNISIARFDAVPDFDPFQWYMDCRRRWEELMGLLREDRNLSGELQDGM